MKRERLKLRLAYWALVALAGVMVGFTAVAIAAHAEPNTANLSPRQRELTAAWTEMEQQLPPIIRQQYRLDDITWRFIDPEELKINGGSLLSLGAKLCGFPIDQTVYLMTDCYVNSWGTVKKPQLLVSAMHEAVRLRIHRDDPKNPLAVGELIDVDRETMHIMSFIPDEVAGPDPAFLESAFTIARHQWELEGWRLQTCAEAKGVMAYCGSQYFYVEITPATP